MPTYENGREVLCKVCQKKFITSPKHIRYCSRECRDIANRISSSSRSKGVIKENKCHFCGSPFETKYKNDNFCSSDCRDKFKKKEMEEKWINKKERKPPKPWISHMECYL